MSSYLRRRCWAQASEAPGEGSTGPVTPVGFGEGRVTAQSLSTLGVAMNTHPLRPLCQWLTAMAGPGS